MHVRTHTNVVRTPSTWCIHNTEHNTSPMIMRQFDALARCRCRRRRRRPAMNALLFVYSFSSVESWWMLLFWCRRRWIDMIWQNNVVQSAPFDLSAAGRPNPHTHTHESTLTECARHSGLITWWMRRETRVATHRTRILFRFFCLFKRMPTATELMNKKQIVFQSLAISLARMVRRSMAASEAMPPPSILFRFPPNGICSI